MAKRGNAARVRQERFTKEASRAQSQSPRQRRQSTRLANAKAAASSAAKKSKSTTRKAAPKYGAAGGTTNDYGDTYRVNPDGSRTKVGTRRGAGTPASNAKHQDVSGLAGLAKKNRKKKN